MVSNFGVGPGVGRAMLVAENSKTFAVVCLENPPAHIRLIAVTAQQIALAVAKDVMTFENPLVGR